MPIAPEELQRRLAEADAWRLKLRRTTREFQVIGRAVREARLRRVAAESADADRPR